MADRKIMITIDANGKAALAEMKNVEGGANDLTSGLKSIASAAGPIALVATAIYMVQAAVKLAVGESIGYLSKLETANLGISSAFMLGGKYIDQTSGKALEGQAALTAAQADTRDVMAQLQVANMQTIATLDQLVRAYQETLPVAMAKGFNRQQVLDFTTAMVQAAGAIGMSLDMLGEETRSMLTGAIDPRTSRIATVLNLRNEDIAKHKGNATELFDFLMSKLEAYKIAGIASQETWAGLTSNAKDIALQAGGQTFQPLFEAVKYELTEITSHLVTIDQKTKKITWNPEFISGIDSIKGGVTATIAEVYRFSMLLDLAGGSITALGARALKVAEVVTRFMTIGQFGGSLKNGSESLAQWNKMYEERYKIADKALQALADREAGVGKNGASAKTDYQQNAPGKSDEQAKAEKKAAQERAKQAKADAKLIKDAEKEAAVEFANDRLADIKLIAAAEHDASMERITEVLADIKLIADAEHDAEMERIDGVIADVKLVEDARREEQNQLIEFAAERRQLEEQTFRSIGDLRSSNQAALLMAAGDETAALEIQYARKSQLLDEEYQKRISHARQIGMETAAIDQEFALQKEVADKEYAQRRADLWWESKEKYINITQQMATMAGQLMLGDEKNRAQIGKRMLATAIRFMTQELQTFMLGKAKEHVLLALSAKVKGVTEASAATTSLTIGGTMATWWAAFYAANSLNPYGGQAFIPAATAMTAVAGASPVAIGAVNATSAAGATINAIAEWEQAAAWGAGAIAVSAIGEAAASAIEGGTSDSNNAAGYGAGSPASPMVTTASPAAGTQRPMIVNIHVNGLNYGLDTDKLARDIYPSIRKAIADGVH